MRDGTVAVEDGRIAYVGARADAPRGESRDLGDVVLMPGLVNAHCHLELTAMRGFLEDLDFRSWILRVTIARRDVMDRAMLLDAARLGVDEGLRRGVTTFADTCESGVALDAMLERGVRGIVYQEVFGPDPRQRDDAIAGLRDKVARLRALETELVRVGVSPHAPYTVSDALFSAVAEYAQRESLPMAIHIAESEMEHDLVVRGAGAFAHALRARDIGVAPRAPSPIRLLESLGVLAAHPLLIHCVRVDARDIAAIAASRSTVAHCPASNAKLGHGVAPLAELLAARVPVGLGSDSMASNNRMDLLEEARLALLQQRARSVSIASLSASDALALATIGGARALGLDREIGSLEAGKAADLAAFDIRHVAPTFDGETAAVFSVAGSPASFVAVSGRELVRDGKLVDEDPTLAARVQNTADALGRWLAATADSVPAPRAHASPV